MTAAIGNEKFMVGRGGILRQSGARHRITISLSHGVRNPTLCDLILQKHPFKSTGIPVYQVISVVVIAVVVAVVVAVVWGGGGVGGVGWWWYGRLGEE
jgi:hypothetical protein